ncbi:MULTISPECIES: tweety family protein [unclassified Bradyrhizobium]|uniref:tweety family protein n=1 Tax=unclassified Bradyrhizobium TaxID=2631580 RepID=UPI001FF8E713|nr:MULTISPECIES: tweety family protein [unclassified Bradyrhizobium]MCK1346360.1 hypothetical protein [Bradyrhizobium sp. CW11]MCK1588553.1 hypothetical protein [Bradyrhizobium sp. 169]
MRQPDSCGRRPPAQPVSVVDAWVITGLAFCAGIALGFGWGVAVALGTGPIGAWLRGQL